MKIRSLLDQARAAFGKKEYPDKEFYNALRTYFSPETSQQVIDTLAQLQLPLPDHKSLVQGSEGVLLFVNPYGVVLRIEAYEDGYTHFTRFNENPWVVQPLGARRAGEALIEICPGVYPAPQDIDTRAMQKALLQTGVDYWDQQPDNAGFIPLRTLEYPQGFPVVIDRLAVDKLSKAIEPVKKALRGWGFDKDPQEILYHDIKQRFAEAWPQDSAAPDAQKLAAFWQACAAKLQMGHLVKGWTIPAEGEMFKRDMAAEASRAYERKFS